MSGWVAGAAVVGSIGGALISSNAAGSAADAQAQSAANADATQRYMFDAQNKLNAPFRENGLAGQNTLARMLGLSGDSSASDYGSLMRNFSGSDLQDDPGYAFRLKQGQRSLEQSAAARGGLLSGNAGKALQNYGQDAASQEYQNAYNRYQTNRSTQLNALQSMAGQGMQANNTMTASAQNYGNNVSQNQMSAGNARASGYIGQANAINNGISGVGNALMQGQMMDSLNNGGSSTPYSYSEYL